MILSSAMNPAYADATGRHINLLATFQNIGQVPFTASIDDTEPHSRAIYADALAGKFGVVASFPVATLAQAKLDRIAYLNSTCQQALQSIVSAYPPLEVATWPNQLAEAQAFTANSAASTPTLSAIATPSGQTVTALAAYVIAKAAAYTAASGAIVGRRQALTTLINAAASVAAVQAVVW